LIENMGGDIGSAVKSFRSAVSSNDDQEELSQQKWQ